MRVTVNQSRCQGHALCAMHAPDLFDVDDGGHSFVVRPPGPGSVMLDEMLEPSVGNGMQFTPLPNTKWLLTCDFMSSMVPNFRRYGFPSKRAGTAMPMTAQASLWGRRDLTPTSGLPASAMVHESVD